MINEIDLVVRLQREKSTITLSIVGFVGLVALLLFSALPSLAAGSGDGVGDAERGKQLFEKRCAGCHALDIDKEGPRLRNVYGRKSGSIPTFKYSDTMKSAQLTWDDASLDKWLIDPQAVVPDTDMDFHVPKADERADIIRFLRVASGK